MYSWTALGQPKRSLEAPGEGWGPRILQWGSEVALNAGLLIALLYLYNNLRWGLRVSSGPGWLLGLEKP